MCEVDSVTSPLSMLAASQLFFRFLHVQGRHSATLNEIVGVRTKRHNSALDRDIGPKFRT